MDHICEPCVQVLRYRGPVELSGMLAVEILTVWGPIATALPDYPAWPHLVEGETYLIEWTGQAPTIHEFPGTVYLEDAIALTQDWRHGVWDLLVVLDAG